MSDALEHAFRIGMGEAQPRFPTVLDRLIHLRTLPSLGRLAASGLTYVATHAVERHYAVGETIYSPDEPVTAAHFLVEGRARVEQEGLHLLDGVPPFAIGFFPVLARSSIGQSAVALEPTVTLEVSRRDLLEVFEDDFGFLENGIRQMARQLVNTQLALESRGLLERSEPVETPYPHEPLDLVERLELFDGGLYQDMNVEPLVHLARLSEELRLEPGDVLWEIDEPSTWGLNVVHGVIACEAPERSFVMGPGSSLGYLEAYGLLPRSYRAVAQTRVVAMRQPAELFFDVLEDNSQLALAFVALLAGFTLDISLKLARAERDEKERDEKERDEKERDDDHDVERGGSDSK